jgi:phenylpyruvate tautomerase PptA (4-oxalocrotonate tautomerase family)
MVFVRVHVIKGRLSAPQKDELGAKLIQAVSDVEGLANNQKSKEASWVQFYEFEPENWYAPANLDGANPNSRIQLDVVVPQKLVSSPDDDRSTMGKVTEAVRSVLGPDPLPGYGPWVHLYVLPLDQFALDGRIPDWEGFRAGLAPVT